MQIVVKFINISTLISGILIDLWLFLWYKGEILLNYFHEPINQDNLGKIQVFLVMARNLLFLLVIFNGQLTDVLLI